MKTTRPLLTIALLGSLAAPGLAQPFAPLPPAPEATPPAAAPAPDSAPDAVPMPPPEAAPSDMPATPAEAPPSALPAPLPEAPPPASTAAAAPVAAPVAAPAAPPTESESQAKEPESKCLIGDLCVGPLFTLGAINALGLGAHARYGKYVGFGLDYQWFPNVTVGDASAGWSLVTGEGRWYPFGGAFWLGGGLALQTFRAGVTGHTSLGDVGLNGKLTMPAFKLGLGFMGHDGFVMGIDLSANIPLGGTHVGFAPLSGAAANIPEGQQMRDQLQQKINDAANKGVKLIPFIPQLNLVRIGYLF